MCAELPVQLPWPPEALYALDNSYRVDDCYEPNDGTTHYPGVRWSKLRDRTTHPEFELHTEKKYQLDSQVSVEE